jgi:hypothetical protein
MESAIYGKNEQFVQRKELDVEPESAPTQCSEKRSSGRTRELPERKRGRPRRYQPQDTELDEQKARAIAHVKRERSLEEDNLFLRELFRRTTKDNVEFARQFALSLTYADEQ